MRRRTLQSKSEGNGAQIKRYNFTGNSERAIQIPLDFEPKTVLMYDHYPYEYLVANGSISYENNGGYPLHISDGNFAFDSVPYDASKTNYSYRVDNEVTTYENGIFTISPYAVWKAFQKGHRYTIIIIGEVTEEELTL